LQSRENTTNNNNNNQRYQFSPGGCMQRNEAFCPLADLHGAPNPQMAIDKLKSGTL